MGLAALFLVPLVVASRLERDFRRIDALERSRLGIGDAIAAAARSDAFLTYRYTEPGAASRYRAADAEYRKLVAEWRKATLDPQITAPLNGQSRKGWNDGTAAISHWIDGYLKRYTGAQDPGGSDLFDREEARFRDGLASLERARDGARLQEIAVRNRLQWLNTAQLTIVTPMAIICFAVAFLAWMNVRTLHQTWAREREIRGALEVAVKESNHRIKNNLQLIGSLIDMQLQDPEPVVPKSALEDVVHQVRAVAAVHDFFSRELRSDQVDGEQMLRRLVDLAALPIGLTVDVETETMALALKQATAVALIANELLQNAGKHGATRARVFMKATGPVAQLRVLDNGPGFPPGFDVARDANLGLSLVDTLARHDLRGSVLFANESGARVEVTFPLKTAA